MQPLRAQSITTGLHAFLDEVHIAVSEWLEVRQDVHVDQVRGAEPAHIQMHLLAYAARLPGRQRFAVVFRFGVDVPIDFQGIGHDLSKVRRVRADHDRRLL